MHVIRRSEERGRANHGWLDSHHTFSFGDYHDPRAMGFRALRVINEDRIKGGTGFPTHPHRDMEILSYVIEGALEHKDSMGTSTIIRPGEIQRMSAGTGVAHSEYNHLKDGTTHFLQIWILPEKVGIAPGYGQMAFADKLRGNRVALIASRGGRDGSIGINQDVDLSVAKPFPGGSVSFVLRPGRHAWVQMIRGRVEAAGHVLSAGDGFAVSDEPDLTLEAKEPSEFLVFDLA
jgi:redox-sensitive bicupin YhaK (pirin superfamily)